MSDRTELPALDDMLRRLEDDEADHHIIAVMRNKIRQRGLMYEDDLPADMTDAEYDDWYAQSEIVEGVRMGPKFSRGLIRDTNTGDLFA